MASFSTPSPRAANAGEYCPAPSSSCSSAGRGALVFDSSERVGDGPPGRDSAPAASSTAAASGSYAPSRTSAIEAQAKGFGLRRGGPRLIVALHRGRPRTARVFGHHASDGVAGIAPRIGRHRRLVFRRSGRALRPRGRARSGTASVSALVSAATRRRIADQSQRERRHLAHVGIGVGQRADQRLRRRRGARRGRSRARRGGGRAPRNRSTSTVRSGARRRRRRRRGAACCPSTGAAAGRRRRAAPRARRISPVLELQHPRHLLLERRSRGGRARRQAAHCAQPAVAGTNERRGRHDDCRV